MADENTDLALVVDFLCSGGTKSVPRPRVLEILQACSNNELHAVTDVVKGLLKNIPEIAERMNEDSSSDDSDEEAEEVAAPTRTVTVRLSNAAEELTRLMSNLRSDVQRKMTKIELSKDAKNTAILELGLSTPAAMSVLANIKPPSGKKEKTLVGLVKAGKDLQDALDNTATYAMMLALHLGAVYVAARKIYRQYYKGTKKQDGSPLTQGDFFSRHFGSASVDKYHKLIALNRLITAYPKFAYASCGWTTLAKNAHKIHSYLVPRPEGEWWSSIDPRVHPQTLVFRMVGHIEVRNPNKGQKLDKEEEKDLNLTPANSPTKGNKSLPQVTSPMGVDEEKLKDQIDANFKSGMAGKEEEVEPSKKKKKKKKKKVVAQPQPPLHQGGNDQGGNEESDSDDTAGSYHTAGSVTPTKEDL